VVHRTSPTNDSEPRALYVDPPTCQVHTLTREEFLQGKGNEEKDFSETGGEEESTNNEKDKTKNRKNTNKKKKSNKRKKKRKMNYGFWPQIRRGMKSSKFSENCFDNLCQGQLAPEYFLSAVQQCKWVLVSTIEDSEARETFVRSRNQRIRDGNRKRAEGTPKRQLMKSENRSPCRKVVAFLLIADHSRLNDFETDGKKLPVCKDTELYLDVVCALPGYGCGQALLAEMERLAQRLGKSAVTLSAVRRAVPYWQKMGFSFCSSEQIMCTRPQPARQRRSGSGSQAAQKPPEDCAPKQSDPSDVLYGFKMARCVPLGRERR